MKDETVKAEVQPITPTELAETRHLLICLAEECAEVIQACSKALRFGLDDDHQAGNPAIVSPRLYIQRELIDINAVVTMLKWRGVFITGFDCDGALQDAKIKKLTAMMAYAREKGTL